jgi:hypothetical protein
MDSKYQTAIESLDEHLAKLQEIYRDSIPRVMATIAAQHPELPEDELRSVTVQVLDQQEELAQILYVLGRWTDAFGQLRDGLHEQLQAVVLVVEEAFNLFFTGDIEGAQNKADKALFKSTNFLIGNVFLAHAGIEGPATIPGSHGPIGAHLILVPQDEVSVIMLMMVLYLHEFRHDVFADVEGLVKEEADAVKRSIKEAYDSGNIKLSNEKIKIGSWSGRTIDVICQLFLDNLGEIDADLVGGIQMSGVAFALNMILVFSAFNSKPSGSAIRNPQLLNVDGSYDTSKEGVLQFEAHPPDYLRLYINAAALELMGFADQAAEIRGLADEAVGKHKPQVVNWFFEETKRKQPISIAWSDLLQVVPIVAKAILMTPFKALNGKSNHDVVAWTPKREAKVQALEDALVAGTSQITVQGDVYASYVAAAATRAFWRVIREGKAHAGEAPARINELALQMLAEAQKRLTEKQAALKTTAKPAPKAPVK